MNDTTVTVLVAGDPDRAPLLAAPLEPHVEVIGRVPTGNEALARVLTDAPDVLLLATSIEDPDARAVCRRMREWAPATRVLALAEDDDEAAYTTVVAGASGAVIVGHGTPLVALPIREIARGEAILPSRMARRLLHDLDAWAARAADPIHPPPTLTATEREVLERLGRGSTSAEIAAIHSVTAHLVNQHVGFAVAKLHRYVLGDERITAEQ